jgi:hypothetical protein
MLAPSRQILIINYKECAAQASYAVLLQKLGGRPKAKAKII